MARLVDYGGKNEMSQALNSHYDYLFKVILVGAEENIKTGLLWAFTGNSDVIADYKNTIGVNFGINSIFISDFSAVCKLQIWDISSDERIKYLRPQYFRGASGCIMVIQNLKEAKTLFEEIQTHCNKPIPIFFILINDSSSIPQINEQLEHLKIEIVPSSYNGIEWLARKMLSCRRTMTTNFAALYSISSDEIQATLYNLQQELLRSEIEHYETLRIQRANQLKCLKETLREMEIPVVNDFVRIISSTALIEINIITGTASVLPITCEQCREPCKKQARRLCIIRADDGHTENLDQNLDQKSLLTLSIIFAFITNQIPKHIRDQIKNILRCTRFQNISY